MTSRFLSTPFSPILRLTATLICAAGLVSPVAAQPTKKGQVPDVVGFTLGMTVDQMKANAARVFGPVKWDKPYQEGALGFMHRIAYDPNNLVKLVVNVDPQGQVVNINYGQKIRTAQRPNEVAAPALKKYGSAWLIRDIPSPGYDQVMLHWGEDAKGTRFVTPEQGKMACWSQHDLSNCKWHLTVGAQREGQSEFIEVTTILVASSRRGEIAKQAAVVRDQPKAQF